MTVTCEALINKFLMDYHAGNLPIARRLEFELHLTLCKDCKNYVDSYRKTVLLAKTTLNQYLAVPEELVKVIMRVTQNDCES